MTFQKLIIDYLKWSICWKESINDMKKYEKSLRFKKRFNIIIKFNNVF